MTKISELLYGDDKTADATLRSGIAGMGMGIATGFVPKVTTDAVAATLAVLSMPVSDVLWWAAESQARIRQAMDRTAGHPSRREVVTLTRQHLESSQRPQVMVEIAGVETHLFDFDLTIDLTVDSLVAEVEGGELKEVRAGSATSKASLDLIDPSGRRRVPVFSSQLASIDLN
ncbi:MAG: hypothetical protein OEZ14_15460 [Acidimicrobiia bacterium]|nr:hypothetical protein [Acidimicrobiia bacterium]MDH5521919.1 hypothetical protein [Acidimicrobiia bacterium]